MNNDFKNTRDFLDSKMRAYFLNATELFLKVYLRNAA